LSVTGLNALLSVQKWMTLPQLSGNMSQLKCRLFPAFVWIGEKRTWRVRRLSRRINANLTASRAILQAFDAHFLVYFLCLKTI
jgi:hypothetical protein